MPSLHESVPGQLTTSVISRAPDSARPRSREALPDVVDGLVADPAEHEVLLDGRAGEAAGEVAHDLTRGRGTARAMRSPRVTFTTTVEKPSWRCGLDVRGAEALELGDVAVRRCVAGRDGRSLRPPRRTCPRAEGARSRSRARRPNRPGALRQPISRKASMPILSTRTLMRARARLTRSQFWRSKMRRTASVTLR